MSKLNSNEAEGLNNACARLRETQLGTHIKTLEDFVGQNTLSTNADTLAGAVNELRAMIVNNDCASIEIPPPGFFTLFADDDTGRLMCYYNDEDHPPAFRHVTDTSANDYGALYLCIADPQGDNHYEVQIATFIPATSSLYYTKSEVDTLIGNINNYITS